MTEIKLPPLPHCLTTYEFPDGAYSMDEMQAYATAAVEADRARFENGYGMTLRDAMALSVSMPDDLAVSWATVLVGSASPGLDANAVEQIDWWARAEAAYRYRIADAMLKVRETK